jgi:thymidylate kinase
VLDEGHVQALWSVGLRGDLTPVLEQLDDLGPAFRARAADLLVVVDVPPEVALARLERRRSRHSRIQHLDRPERLAELRRGADLLDRLAAWWPGRPDVHPEVVRLDGTAGDGTDLGRLAARIAAAASAAASLPAAPPG